MLLFMPDQALGMVPGLRPDLRWDIAAILAPWLPVRRAGAQTAFAGNLNDVGRYAQLSAISAERSAGQHATRTLFNSMKLTSTPLARRPRSAAGYLHHRWGRGARDQP